MMTSMTPPRACVTTYFDILIFSICVLFVVVININTTKSTYLCRHSDICWQPDHVTDRSVASRAHTCVRECLCVCACKNLCMNMCVVYKIKIITRLYLPFSTCNAHFIQIEHNEYRIYITYIPTQGDRRILLRTVYYS